MNQVKNWLRYLCLVLKSLVIAKKAKLTAFENFKKMKDLTLSIAESEQDLKNAFNLVYRSYQEFGIVASNQREMNLSRFHLLPSTAVVIMKHKATGEVIATATIISDSALGLPLDEYEDLSELRKIGKICECGSLAIDRRFRKLRGEVYLQLMRFVYQKARELFGVQIGVYMVHPKAVDFYRLVLSAKCLSKKIFAYSSGTGVPAISMVAPVSVKNLNEVCQNKFVAPFTKKILRYIKEPSIHEANRSREGSFHSDYQSLYNVKTLSRVFAWYRDIYPEEYAQNHLGLKNIFFSSRYQHIFSDGKIDYIQNRRSPRLLSKCLGEVKLGLETEKVYTSNVSHRGLLFISAANFELGELIDISLQIGAGKTVKVKVCPVWKSEQGQFGARIVESQSKLWDEYISHLIGIVSDSHSVGEIKLTS